MPEGYGLSVFTQPGCPSAKEEEEKGQRANLAPPPPTRSLGERGAGKDRPQSPSKGDSKTDKKVCKFEIQGNAKAPLAHTSTTT